MGADQMSIWDGTSWAPATSLDSIFPTNVSLSGPDVHARAAGLSCVSATWCMLVNEDLQSAIWDGSTWTTLASIRPGENAFAMGLWCNSPTACILDGFDSIDAAWNGSTWTNLGPSIGLAADACGSATMCIGFTNDGTPLTSSGNTGSWSRGQASLWPGQQVNGIRASCSSATSCVAVAAVGSDLERTSYNGIAWSTPAVLLAGANNTGFVQCDSSRCVAIAHEAGDFSNEVAFTETLGLWGGPHTIVHDNVEVAAACKPGGACAVVDSTGNVRALLGSTWSAPLNVDPSAQVTGVACNAVVCGVIDAGGGAVMYSANGWQARQVVDSVGLDAITCASDGSCVAVDGNGGTVRYENGVWSPPAPRPAPQNNPMATAGWKIGCGSANYCVLADPYNAWINAGTGWTLLTSPPGEGVDTTTAFAAPGALACSAPTTCTLTGDQIPYLYANWLPDDSWSGRPIQLQDTYAPQYLSDGLSMACPAADLCVVTETANGDIATISQTGATSTSSPINLNGADSVACSSTSFCLGLDNYGVIATATR
ncbi:hypothetical protein [Nocardioides baekrokdamisoli]|uniref:hypothetical protein n=1 Tax=Nocardioides baekrokdamisoli TaxID=1804624 RepID=UPI000F78FBC1|nr:hypothetical protein [Nocardioides baekrokdamisoli]